MGILTHGTRGTWDRPEDEAVAETIIPTDAGGLDALPPVPPLVDGERLTRAEFHRRYEAMPQLKKAELIEGVVHMPSPVRYPQHCEPHGTLLGWLFTYRASTPGVDMGPEPTVILGDDAEVQPDAVLRISTAAGGQSRIDEDGYLVGTPELVAEVAASSARIDLHAKLRDYQRGGVREYVVWRVLDRAIDWFVLRDGVFVSLQPQPDGTYHSEVFPGLWLDPAAMAQQELPRLLAVLAEGLASPEHAAFVAELQRRLAASSSSPASS
jgi:Uma2 family endonuclease